jgi:hypothetical protein
MRRLISRPKPSTKTATTFHSHAIMCCKSTPTNSIACFPGGFRTGSMLHIDSSTLPLSGSMEPVAAPRSVAHVSKQLVGFKKFGSGGKLLIFDYNRLTFDYTPYAAALHQASTPEVITNQAPTLVITSHTSGNFQTSSNTLSLAGYAKDDLAIKAVRWSNDRGGSGATPTNWQVFSKYDYASFISFYQTPWDWQTNFSTEIALQPGLNKITVEAQDIHGLKTAQVLNVVSGKTPCRRLPRRLRPGCFRHRS